MKTAVLGLGRMGQALASRLLSAGCDVTLWNRSPGKAGELVAAGARAADDVSAAVADVEVVFTSLSDDDAVRAVADELLVVLPAGATFAEASTISPRLSAELATQFPRFAATPILGAPAAVASGAATHLLGGPDDVASLLAPVLHDIAGSVRRYPSAPQASVAKLVNNALLLTAVAGLAEALTVGRAGGLSDAQLSELLADSPMLAPGIRNRFDGVLTGEQEAWWSTRLGAKDARLAVEVVGRARLPLLQTVHERFRAAAEAGFADADIVAVGALYRD